MRSLAQVAAIVAVVGAATYMGFLEKHAGKPSFVVIVGLPTVLFAVYGVFRARRDGVLRERFAVRGGDFTIGALTAAGLFGGAYAFTHYVAPLGTPRSGWLLRIYLQVGDPAVLREKIPYVVAALVVVVVAEEIVWRYLVPTLLEDVVGSRRAWMVAAVCYSVAHAPTAFSMWREGSGYNPLLPIAALGCGLVWGAVTYRLGGRLLPSIFSHALFDWAVVMMFRLFGPSV
ncbi:MAG: CPBP family intramembrane metalloprotease [Myxococcales bacterium]|jgi:membrane protease YdiL (CAAX protease family)|nr:CPBP family intramembrane metalloprotease [Myxococcales bacterium]